MFGLLKNNILSIIGLIISIIILFIYILAYKDQILLWHYVQYHWLFIKINIYFISCFLNLK